nr:restriction endonuclease subunit S [uncultured Deefgea sp.]
MVPNGWSCHLLSEICGKQISYGIVQTGENLPKGTPCLRVVDLTKNVIQPDEMIRTSDEINNAYKKTILEKDEIVMALRGEVGLVRLIDFNLEGANITRGLARISAKKDVIYPEFLLWELRSPKFRADLIRRVGGSALQEISLTELRKVRTLVPPLPEQKKIAEILSTWDQAIAKTERILDLARQQKRALMQQLLTGKKRLLTSAGQRFDGDWEFCSVNDFFKVGSSKRVLQEDWTDSGVPFYRTRELVSLNKNEPFRSEIFISERLFAEISEKYETPSTGDFLVSGVGTLGICYQVKDGDRFYFKDGNVLWFKREGDIDSDFFYHCFQSDFIQKQITDQAAVTTVGTYTIQNAKKTKLYCPPTLEEQRKVAAVLNSAAQEIETLQSQLDGLKQEKKALMQTLLTGKRRVNVMPEEI